VAVVVIGSFMAVLDTSIVNVAIPSIENELGASADQGEWVVTGYSLMLGVVVPTSSWLGERYGLERVQNVALLLFITGSALCGLSTSISTLIGLRLFQAIGGGLLPAVSLTIVYRVVPRESFGTALGIYGFGVILAPAIGPVVGGFLVQYSSWRLIYFINVPVGIIGAVLSYRVVPHFERKRGQRFDLAGWVTIAVGLFSLLLALSEGQKWHWTSYRVLGLVAVGGLSLALFVVLELSAEAPLLNLRVFLNSNYRTSVMIIAVLSNGLFSAAFFIPLFLQQGDGLNAFQTGLTLVPAVFVTLVMVPLSGRLFDRFGARSLAAPGLLVLALAEYLMRSISTDTSRGQVITWLAIQNLGIGLSFIPVVTGSLSRLASAQVSVATAMNNLVQQVSGAVGLAVLGALLSGYQARRRAGQGDLLPSVAPGVPQLQAVADRGQAGALFLDNVVQLRVFGVALGSVFLVTAGLTAVAVLLSLLLPARQRRPVS
jgi:EmrB/QacA subfamily drug resistance transporter